MSDEEQDAPEPKTAQAQVRLRFADQPDTPTVYCNNVNLTFSPHEFTFHFGHYVIPAVVEPPEDGVLNVDVRPVAKVSFPLGLARDIARVLMAQADAWEKNFGRELPPSAGRLIGTPSADEGGES